MGTHRICKIWSVSSDFFFTPLYLRHTVICWHGSHHAHQGELQILLFKGPSPTNTDTHQHCFEIHVHVRSCLSVYVYL